MRPPCGYFIKLDLVSVAVARSFFQSKNARLGLLVNKKKTQNCHTYAASDGGGCDKD
jgi:hypothetical protein